MSTTSLAPASRRTVIMTLLPIMTVVLVAFLVIGLALPVLPLHVHQDLGYGTFVVGLVTGSQFAASLFSRVWSGNVCDRRGPKYSVIFGLVAASAAGLLYLLSLWFTAHPIIALSVLLAGRAVLGGAESFIITGATVWGLGLVGASNAGKVIAWMGTAMFAAFAAGAPLGIALYSAGGFAAIAAATMIAPLLTLAVVFPLRTTPPEHRRRAGILAVARQIWLPGLGAALSSIGFGVILSFASLLFAANGWTPVWLAFTTYAVALVIARLAFGHLPDRLGGAKVALICVLIEVAGLVLMGLAPSTLPAALGAGLVGFGYALVFPGLGVEAVRRAPPESRGLAMGAYTACLDLALGISGPGLGLVATEAGLSAVFLVSSLAVLGSAFISLKLMNRDGTRSQPTSEHASPSE
jgi:MFS family permease